MMSLCSEWMTLWIFQQLFFSSLVHYSWARHMQCRSPSSVWDLNIVYMWREAGRQRSPDEWITITSMCDSATLFQTHFVHNFFFHTDFYATMGAALMARCVLTWVCRLEHWPERLISLCVLFQVSLRYPEAFEALYTLFVYLFISNSTGLVK